MNVVFRLQGIEFEWDREKYAVNLRKHSVKFEEAAEDFFDRFNITAMHRSDLMKGHINKFKLRITLKLLVFREILFHAANT